MSLKTVRICNKLLNILALEKKYDYKSNSSMFYLEDLTEHVLNCNECKVNFKDFYYNFLSEKLPLPINIIITNLIKQKIEGEKNG